MIKCHVCIKEVNPLSSVWFQATNLKTQYNYTCHYQCVVQIIVKHLMNDLGISDNIEGLEIINSVNRAMIELSPNT